MRIEEVLQTIKDHQKNKDDQVYITKSKDQCGKVEKVVHIHDLKKGCRTCKEADEYIKKTKKYIAPKQQIDILPSAEEPPGKQRKSDYDGSTSICGQRQPNCTCHVELPRVMA